MTWMQFFGEVLFTIGIVWAVAVAYSAVIGVIEFVIMPMVDASAKREK